MQSVSPESLIWTNIKYNEYMNKREPKLMVERIESEMQRRGLQLSQVAKYAGVSYDMMYKLLNTNRPRTSAEVVAKLAETFGCSVEYLMGLTDERVPNKAVFGELPLELANMARLLPGRRQRDLIAIARTYMQMYAEQDLETFTSDVLDLIEQYGGKEDRDQLVALLESTNGDIRALLFGDESND